MLKMATIEANDISTGWARALAAAAEPGVEALVPLVVSVRFDPAAQSFERPGVRAEADRFLAECGAPPCHTTANTIFPASLWNPNKPRSVLFERYRRILPRIGKVRRNIYGVYFGRMVAYGESGINQIEHVISTYHTGNRRPSALQLGIFDPTKDHTNQRQRGFPCLQQVNFIPDGDDGLLVEGTYAMQYLVDRAYGNYLGLSRLGSFVAQEAGRRLTAMICVAPKAVLGSVGKRQVAPFLDRLRAVTGEGFAS